MNDHLKQYWCFYKNRTLLKQMVLRNIQSRFRGSVLGLVWAFIYPVLMLGIYTFIFGVLFKSRWGNDSGENIAVYAVLMFSGIALYNIFSESTSICTQIIIGHQNYVKKICFPLPLLPVAQVLAVFLLGLIWILIVLAAAFLIWHRIPWSWILLFFSLPPLLLFSCGISLFVASLGVYLRDIQHLIGMILQIFFFLSPVFYRAGNLPAEYLAYLQWNPMLWLIELNRHVIFYGNIPDYSSLPGVKHWMICYFIGIIFYCLGFEWFCKTRKGFNDVL